MMTGPDDALDYATTASIATAGAFCRSVGKAAEFAELPPEAVNALRLAAALAERHAHGYGPADGDAGALYAALGEFVAAMRERARAARAAA